MKSGNFSRAVTVLGCLALGFVSRAASIQDYYLGEVTLNQGSWSSGYGGEFTGTVLPGSNTQIPTVVSTFDQTLSAGRTIVSAGSIFPTQDIKVGGTSSFQTFCIQEGLHDVVYYPGYSYYGILTDSIASGPQTVNAIAAYLFDQFSRGTLSNYDYTGANRKASAGQLQAAIWYAEGDRNNLSETMGDAGIGSTGQASAWISEAQTYLQTHAAPTDVKIMEMYGIDPGNSDLHIAQAQLVRVNIPSVGTGVPTPLPPAAFVGMAMLGGFVGFRFLMRRSTYINI